MSKAGGVNPMPPGHTSSTVRGSYTRKEGSGVNYGLSRYESLDSESQGMEIDNDVDAMTGNATQRIKANPKKTTASEKGNSFDIC